MEKKILKLYAEDTMRLDKYLSEQLNQYSRSFFANLISNGGVLVDGKPVSSSFKPRIGSEIYIEFEDERPLDAIAQDIPIDIVYQDSDIVVINKSRGMVVHPAAGNPDGTLVNALLYHVKDLSSINGVMRPGIVHRLDKDTTGLIVVAKNDRAHESLAAQIAERTVTKIYQALVFGNVKEPGTINAPIDRHRNDRKKMAVVREGGRNAVTHYEVLESFGKYTLLKIKLETGRTHQIRVHMAHIGHPVVGDEVYTRLKPPFKTQGQLLHSHELSVIHPSTDENIHFIAPLPTDFLKALELIRQSTQMRF